MLKLANLYLHSALLKYKAAGNNDELKEAVKDEGKTQVEKLKEIQEGLDVKHFTEKYKLDTYTWELDEFLLCEKQVDGDFSYLADSDIKQTYDAIQLFFLMNH